MYCKYFTMSTKQFIAQNELYLQLNIGIAIFPQGDVYSTNGENLVPVKMVWKPRRGLSYREEKNVKGRQLRCVNVKVEMVTDNLYSWLLQESQYQMSCFFWFWAKHPKTKSHFDKRRQFFLEELIPSDKIWCSKSISGQVMEQQGHILKIITHTCTIFSVLTESYSLVLNSDQHTCTLLFNWWT